MLIRNQSLKSNKTQQLLCFINSFITYIMILILFIIFNIFSACSLNNESKENTTSTSSSEEQLTEEQPAKEPPSALPPEVLALTTRDHIESYATGARYYLDAVKGNDTTGNGSSEKPWQSISKSQEFCPEGSLIYLRDGDYGSFNDNAYSSSRTNWTVYINEEGAIPKITSVSCLGNHDYDLRLIFYGIKIAPSWVNPGSSAPYNKTASPIYIRGSNYISFYNCEIVGTNKYLTTQAVYLREADYIQLERCHIHKVGEGIVYINSSHITMDYNYVHEVCACFFKDGYVGNSYITIEGNHAHDAGFSNSDQYGEDAAYHGSMIALNNATTTVRNNILHDGGGTNAINFYTDGNPIYSDVLIENNLVYNPTATTCVDVEHVADNVVIRNNIFIGKKRNEDFGEYMYNNAIYIGSYASGYDGSGLSIYNNIFVGRAVFTPSISTAYINKDYNIAYYGNDFATTHSIIALSIPDSDYFESGFFNGPLDLEYGSTSDQVLDLIFTTSSDGINFGDSNFQPSDCLGTLDPSGFIIPISIVRDNSHHSVGCYEIN